jgi:hypothetical protein
MPHPELELYADRRVRAEAALTQLRAKTENEYELDALYRGLGLLLLDRATEVHESDHPVEVEALRAFLRDDPFSGSLPPHIHIGELDPRQTDMGQLVSIVAFLVADGGFIAALASCAMLVSLVAARKEHDRTEALGLPESDYTQVSKEAYEGFWAAVFSWLDTVQLTPDPR